MMKTGNSFVQQKYSMEKGFSPNLTRQGFLKLAGLGLLGTLFPGGWITEQGITRLAGDPMQGRVTEEKADVFDKPSFSGNKVKLIWRDTVFPITAATIGDDEPSYNRVWYQIGEEGFIHSGLVQPVRTLVNQPAREIPATGVLAEVTVPFTDARRAPGRL